jgi:hypothetical protein
MAERERRGTVSGIGPVPGDGFLEYTFVDSVTPEEAAARFSRIRVPLLP